MVYFGEKSSKITVFLSDFSSKLTIVRPNLSPGVLIKSDVLFARIRYQIRRVTFIKNIFNLINS